MVKEVESAVTAAAAGSGRRAVLLKDGRKKADALREAKGNISTHTKAQKEAGKAVTSLEKQIKSAEADIETGKAAAAALKDLKVQHKTATKAHADATKGIDKHTAEYQKIEAFQPK